MAECAYIKSSSDKRCMVYHFREDIDFEALTQQYQKDICESNPRKCQLATCLMTLEVYDKLSNIK